MLPLKPPYSILHFINILPSPNICTFWDTEIFLYSHPIFSVFPNLTFLTSEIPKFKFNKFLPHALSWTQNEPKEPKRSQINPHLDYETAVHILLEDAAYRCFDLAHTDLAHWTQIAQPTSNHQKMVSSHSIPKANSMFGIWLSCAASVRATQTDKWFPRMTGYLVLCECLSCFENTGTLCVENQMPMCREMLSMWVARLSESKLSAELIIESGELLSSCTIFWSSSAKAPSELQTNNHPNEAAIAAKQFLNPQTPRKSPLGIATTFC